MHVQAGYLSRMCSCWPEAILSYPKRPSRIVVGKASEESFQFEDFFVGLGQLLYLALKATRRNETKGEGRYWGSIAARTYLELPGLAVELVALPPVLRPEALHLLVDLVQPHPLEPLPFARL